MFLKLLFVKRVIFKMAVYKENVIDHKDKSSII